MSINCRMRHIISLSFLLNNSFFSFISEARDKALTLKSCFLAKKQMNYIICVEKSGGWGTPKRKRQRKALIHQSRRFDMWRWKRIDECVEWKEWRDCFSGWNPWPNLPVSPSIAFVFVAMHNINFVL